MTNAELARNLELFADLQELDGENRFRIRAYRNAAHNVYELPDQVASLVASGSDLEQIPGVGKEIAEKLRVMVETGEMPQLSELSARIPVGVASVMRVKGMGPKLAAAAWTELGVDSVDALANAAEEGLLGKLPGFGPKRQQSILKSIEAHRRNVERVRLGEIDPVVAPLVAELRAVAGARCVEVAGSYRRRRETVGDIDLLVAAEDEDAAAAITKAFVGFTDVEEVLGSGPTRSSVRLKNGLEVDLRVLGEDAFGAGLLYFTGSKAHNVELRQLALDKGWHLTEYGLFEGTGAEGASPLSSGKRLASKTEEEIYAALGLPYIEPELREGRGEIKAALAGELPNLVTTADVRGDLHMHSTWSDGRSSVEEMLLACAERGYEYMALTDHSKALAMTGGLDEEKLARQWEELDAVTAAHPHVTLLRGLEVDILKDGSLDLSDEWLQKLDIVLVSVHSHFSLPLEEQTARIVKAVSHPQVNVLCHPTGRVLGAREGYAVDLAQVFEACAKNGVAVELNASYQRLDLSDVNLIAARNRGLMISVATDAHSVKELDGMALGVQQARRAWLTREHVLNCLPLSAVREFLAK
ncbi:MAG: DNA polymerase/3'-5' exonuclease PolX [Trueperaceae bacterium]